MGTQIDVTLKLHSNSSKQMFEAFLDELNKAIQKKRNRIKQRIISLVVEKITSCEEYHALVNNSPEDYQAEFGIISPGRIKQVLDDGIQILVKQYRLYFTPFKAIGRNKVTGAFRFQMIKSGFEEFVNTSGGSYNSNEYEIEWLRWIVLMGDYTIDSYSIEYELSNKEISASRSGRAIMVEDGGHWLVPEPFRGDNAQDNFITRALTDLDNQITEILIDEVST